jgi:membrane protein YdbS with pleckstrin-like domain
MTYDEERVIRPPIDQISSGRVFQPTNAFLYKKMLKVGILLVLIWIALRLLFIGFSNPTFMEIILDLSKPLEILSMIGWEVTNLFYIIASVTFFFVGTVYSFIYVRRIEYSVIGWSGDAMPFIYTRKGIINITKKHVPFRTIVNVRTRKGLFDRLLGIGNVLIETASGSKGVQATGLAALLIQRLRSTAEEKIEGINFHEELRDFILREMRFFGYKSEIQKQVRRGKQRTHIFNRGTLELFKEVRDVLKENSRTNGGY